MTLEETKRDIEAKLGRPMTKEELKLLQLEYTSFIFSVGPREMFG